MTQEEIKKNAQRIALGLWEYEGYTGARTDKPGVFMAILGLYDLIFSQWFRAGRNDGASQAVAVVIQAVVFNFIVAGVANDSYFHTFPHTIVAVLFISMISYFSAEGIRTSLDDCDDHEMHRAANRAKAFVRFRSLVLSIRSNVTESEYRSIERKVDEIRAKQNLTPFSQLDWSGKTTHKILGYPEENA